MERRQAAAVARRTGGDRSNTDRRASAPRPDPGMLRLPKQWFVHELYKTIRKTVRGPLSKGRRRQATVRMRMPREAFDHLMRPVKDSEIAGFSRTEDGVIQPTQRTSAADIFHYEIAKPMVTDRIFSLEQADAPAPFKQPPAGASRRGLGCAVLKLGDTAHKKNMAAAVFSMIGGNCIVRYRQPRSWGGWPTLTMKFWVLTVDHQGGILWPTSWSANSRALLTELARRKVEAFVNDPKYPIAQTFCRTPGASSRMLTQQEDAGVPPPLLLQ